jgi:hypothetical protein
VRGSRLLNLVAQASFGHNHKPHAMLCYRTVRPPHLRLVVHLMEERLFLRATHPVVARLVGCAQMVVLRIIRPLHNGSVTSNVRQIVHTILISPSILS